MTDDTGSQPPHDTPESEEHRRPWLIPAAFVALSAVVLVLLVAFNRGGGDDDTTEESSVPVATVAATTTDGGSEEASTTIAPGGGGSPPTSAGGNGAVDCAEYVLSDSLPVGLCNQGTLVGEVQRGLNGWGASVEADGFFGNATDTAVRDFQTAQGLGSDGVVEVATWVALCPYVGDILCEPDGGEESAPSDIPNGIIINGQQQNVLYECQHYPFQDGEGIFDSHVGSTQFLVEDPMTGARQVVAVWAEDEARLLVVSDLSSASVAQTIVPWNTPEVSGSVRLAGVDLAVSVNEPGPTSACETMLIEGDQGKVLSYGIVDVCQTMGDEVTVITLTTFWQEDSTHGYSEMNFLNDDLASAQLRLSGDYVPVTSAQNDRSAQNETVSGTFSDEGANHTFFMGISQYPEGGHVCIGGQVVS